MRIRIILSKRTATSSLKSFRLWISNMKIGLCSNRHTNRIRASTTLPSFRGSKIFIKAISINPNLSNITNLSHNNRMSPRHTVNKIIRQMRPKQKRAWSQTKVITIIWVLSDAWKVSLRIGLQLMGKEERTAKTMDTKMFLLCRGSATSKANSS